MSRTSSRVGTKARWRRSRKADDGIMNQPYGVARVRNFNAKSDAKKQRR